MKLIDILEVFRDHLVEFSILIFEFIGVGIIIVSGIHGFYLYLKKSPDTKLALAKGLAMGLEFKLGSCEAGKRSELLQESLYFELHLLF